MIAEFQGPYRFLSNFFRSPISVKGWKVPTVEHAYQLLKFEDAEQQRWVAEAVTASEAKKLGRQLKPIRSNWNADRLQVMRVLLKKKFANPVLRKALLATAPEELVEGNCWNDTYWGVCRDRGENNLGILLMELREELTS